jgi:hypothetical protein
MQAVGFMALTFICYRLGTVCTGLKILREL